MRNRSAVLFLSLVAVLALADGGELQAAARSTSATRNRQGLAQPLNLQDPEGPWEFDDDARALGRQVLALLNAAREDAGLKPLRGHTQLDLVAYQHSVDMAQRNQVSHQSPRFGVTTKSRVRLAFPQVLRYAENVARNQSPKALHSGLMGSAGHRLNRLDPLFTHVGIGAYRVSRYVVFLTEIFVVAPREQMLAEISVLYTAVPAGHLPGEEMTHGEIGEERIHVTAPGRDDPEYWTLLGISDFNEERYQEAVENFERALRIDPGYDYALFDLGRALVRTGRAEESIEALERFLELHPDDLDAWAAAGTAALMASDYPQAERRFRRLVNERPRDAGSWYNLGLALEYQSQLERAETAYLKALGVDPELAAARNALERVRR